MEPVIPRHLILRQRCVGYSKHDAPRALSKVVGGLAFGRSSGALGFVVVDIAPGITPHEFLVVAATELLGEVTGIYP